MRNVHSTGSAHVTHKVILQLGLSDLLGSLCFFFFSGAEQLSQTILSVCLFLYKVLSLWRERTEFY